MLFHLQQIVLHNEQHFDDMNIVGRLTLATHRLDILAVVHAEQAMHTYHDRHIAFLFKFNNLEAKL
jgi:hypothetical protein